MKASLAKSTAIDRQKAKSKKLDSILATIKKAAEDGRMYTEVAADCLDAPALDVLRILGYRMEERTSGGISGSCSHEVVIKGYKISWAEAV